MSPLLASRDQRTSLLLWGVSIILVWATWTYCVGPLQREARRLAEECRLAKAQLSVLEGRLANAAMLRTHVEETQTHVMTFRALLPTEEELPLVMERLSQLASQAHMKIQTIGAERPPESEVGAGRLPQEGNSHSPFVSKFIHLEARAGYHQFGTFLSLVEAADHPMRLWRLRMVNDEKGSSQLHITLILQTYFSTVS